MALPREIIKWIQSLDLTWSVKAPKWDLSNGFLVAEIFSWYFPQDIEMNMYHNATVFPLKSCNWHLLRKAMKKNKINISDDVIEATIHCKDGAAKIFLQQLYEILTNRQLKIVPPEPKIDFTDSGYQSKLPIHARSTAIQAVRNNFRITELMANHNILANRQTAQNIIDRHTRDRELQRIENPERFDRKPTIGELALRQAPPPLNSRRYDDDIENYVEEERDGMKMQNSRISLEEMKMMEGKEDGNIRSNRSRSSKRSSSRGSSSVAQESSTLSESYYERTVNQPPPPVPSSSSSSSLSQAPSNRDETTNLPAAHSSCTCDDNQKILCECCN